MTSRRVSKGYSTLAKRGHARGIGEVGEADVSVSDMPRCRISSIGASAVLKSQMNVDL